MAILSPELSEKMEAHLNIAKKKTLPKKGTPIFHGDTPYAAVVGCGFVGSVFTAEYLRRHYAGKLMHAMLFIDPDTVEHRNTANQEHLQSEVGSGKATAMCKRAGAMNVTNYGLAKRLDPENATFLLLNRSQGHQKPLFVVDGTDNVAARQALWGFAMEHKVPVLHIGITQMGTGKVEWSYPGHTTFSLTPDFTALNEVKDPPSGVTKPCDLVRMRGVGVNIGLAAACAASIFMGFDPERYLSGEKGVEDTRGWMTEWAATPMSHMPLVETWGEVEL